ncbi:MAG: tyrosine--tRNA ligase, partial [Anaerolineales bacterium]|nr:tyrosine--tRNA ligase [Anaerolineales bacterium]
GMIGDPSGRSQERNLLSQEVIEHNVECIKKQLAQFLDFDIKTNPAKLVNNYDWLGKLTMMDFLRDVGKQFSINVMLTKDSVKSRLDGGISYTEFSYMLLQSYDFLHLYQAENCILQTGGSDQWGNITAGSDLIRREGGKAHALVYPLITKADGTKFGKTASGSVWLDPKQTSPYRFYQFWINTNDDDVVKYLKIFTWLSQDEIADLAAKHEEAAYKREAHTKLAQVMTEMLHGPTALQKAEQATEVLFGGSLDGLEAAEIADIFTDVPSTEIAKHEFEGGLNVVDLFAQTNLASGKGDAKRSIDGGGMYINNERVESTQDTIATSDAIEGQFLVLRKGRKKYHLVKIVG